MDKLFNIIRNELNEENNYNYTKWLTLNTPKRISGMGDDRKAAEYISQKFSEFGLESRVINFEAYNSNPIGSEVRLIEPVQTVLKSLPCCHIKSTPTVGADYELLYLGAGDYCDYEGLDVKGKAVLVEVSYNPATPEKARIAYEMGASAMVCANWGEDGNEEHDYVCNRGLKSVWGNPTRETFKNIPQIVGVSITRNAGMKLKKLCQSEQKVIIRIMSQATRSWDMLPMPIGYLKGIEEPDKYVLVNGHLDAWEPGVTCNATGNGTILELARVLAKYRSKIKRSILFICWNGHEIAESAGSTWFIDHNWDDLEKNCIGSINIDSTGMLGAVKYSAVASRELKNMMEPIIKGVLGDEIIVEPLQKLGDQSFFGIGIPSFVGRMGMSEEYIKKTNGASLGWWNHTIKDGIDKVDLKNLKKDLDVACAIILSIVNTPVLGYDFTVTCSDIYSKLLMIKKKSQGIVEIESLIKRATKLCDVADKINSLRNKFEGLPISDFRVKTLNTLILKLSRVITSAFYSYCERVEQNSYAYSPMDNPIPYLYTVVELATMDPSSEEYKLMYTEVIRNRNRISIALSTALEFADLYLEKLNK